MNIYAAPLLLAITVVFTQNTRGGESRSVPVEVLKQFGEAPSVRAAFKDPKTMVIYRLFALSPERWLKSIAVTVKLNAVNAPMTPEPGEFVVKIEGEYDSGVTVRSGILPAADVEQMVTTIFKSEIFSLLDDDQPRNTDDGGHYGALFSPMGYTYIFERTRRDGTVVVTRSATTSSPARDAGEPFWILAQKVWAEVWKGGREKSAPKR